jgi:hypothetical protein
VLTRQSLADREWAAPNLCRSPGSGTFGNMAHQLARLGFGFAAGRCPRRSLARKGQGSTSAEEEDVVSAQRNTSSPLQWTDKFLRSARAETKRRRAVELLLSN